MTWMMITDLDGKCVFRREVGDSASIIRDFSGLVPEGQFIQVVIDDYRTGKEVLKEINRVDIVQHQQNPTFKLEPQIDFRGDDWRFPLTVHYYMDCGFIANVVIPDLKSLYKFGESYGKPFYVSFDDGTEVEFTFVHGVSRKVHKLVQRIF